MVVVGGGAVEAVLLDAFDIPLELLVVAVGILPFLNQGAFQLLPELHHPFLPN